jgi:endonuclease-8
MPEGDTITRTARALDRALRGEIVTALQSPLPRLAAAIGRHRLLGQQVAAVDAHGKHLLLRFSDGAVLHTHQGMRGEWHLYRPKRAWQRPAWLARVVLETPNVVAVCFGAPVVEILSPLAQRGHSWLRRLGPDPLHASFDASAGVRRLRERGGREIGVALLDQGGIAGVGNVYKSELLFLCGISPFAAVAELADSQLERLVAAATRELRRGLGPGLRRTTPALSASPLWVYRRARQPCRRCGTPIARRIQGQPPRSSYWCPGCQPG